MRKYPTHIYMVMDDSTPYAIDGVDSISIVYFTLESAKEYIKKQCNSTTINSVQFQREGNVWQAYVDIGLEPEPTIYSIIKRKVHK